MQPLEQPLAEVKDNANRNAKPATPLTAKELAINGGKPVRATPLPARNAIGAAEQAAMQQVIDWYAARGVDPGYQGHFEEQYCKLFADYHGGGYADAVATGTASLYVALAALQLPPGSHVLVSPITDPGTLSAIILLGLKPKLVDSMPNSYNTGPDQVASRIDSNTKAVVIVHAAGQAVNIAEITALCHKRGIKVLEDCSQAHGARWNNQLVGTFGDIAAFSTMYRKASITGPTGGVVYTRDENLYHLALAYADRGKPRWIKGFDDRDPRQFLFPALNLHSGEFACAIGLASFARLPETIQCRYQFINALSQQIKQDSRFCTPYTVSPQDSPFYFPIYVDHSRLSGSKRQFAEAIRAEGIGLNPHYQYVVAEWDWIKPYLVDDFACANAVAVRDSTFCLYVNESYGTTEVIDTIAAITKVEQYCC